MLKKFSHLFFANDKLSFSLLFILLSILISFMITYEKTSKINAFMEQKSIQKMQNYQVLYKKYKTIATVIFNTEINTAAVLHILKDAKHANNAQKAIIRKNLYKRLDNVYKILKQVNIKQLHFHLPNNDSFLRFHKPQKFGDNLTDIRETIKYVNETLKPIDGFEEGRIYNGYRFVFPLILDNDHLGSVEVSFSGIAISSDFMNNYNQFATLLMSNEVIDKKLFSYEKENYSNSSVQGYSYEKKQLAFLESHSNFKLPKNFSKAFQKRVLQKIDENKEVFTLYDSDLQQLFTFIKLRNPITAKHVALFMIKSSSKYIRNKTYNFYFILLISNLALFFIVFFFYKEVSFGRKMKEVNKDLEKSLEIIKKSQDQLVESEKMAALGTLVSGVAHEVNTPLGNAVTISTVIEHECDSLQDIINSGSLKKSTLLSKLTDISESSKLLHNSLAHASKLIKSFKQVSVDQSSENEREFNVAEYIEEIFSTFKSSLKKIPVQTQINCDETIIINSYPGVFAQIFSNFIQNSILHGFENHKKNAKITVDISKDTQTLRIVYKDNGSGVKESIKQKIFDPFVTTKRNSGGTGLGLNIVYNLVAQKLMGTLSMDSSADTGTSFTIVIPLNDEILHHFDI